MKVGQYLIGEMFCSLLVSDSTFIVDLKSTIVDLHEFQVGSEAEDFLTTLQKYIASIIRNWSELDSVARMKQGDKLEDMYWLEDH